jgi:hypothetical protein
LLAHPPGVEASARDDDLPAAATELLIQPIVEIACAELDSLHAWRKIRGNTIGCLARPLAEKQRNDRIAIKRILFRILLRAVLGHDEGRPG